MKETHFIDNKNTKAVINMNTNAFSFTEMCYLYNKTYFMGHISN